VCLIYAELRAAASHGRSTVSRDHNKHVLVCGRQSGHRLVYSSSTENQLSVTVHAPAPPGEHPLHFLLQFDGLYRYLSALHGEAGLMQLHATVGRPSFRPPVCLSVPSEHRTPRRRVCCCGPGGQMSIDGSGRRSSTAPGTAAACVSQIAPGSECEQCRVCSRRRRLNTGSVDVLCAMWTDVSGAQEPCARCAHRQVNMWGGQTWRAWSVWNRLASQVRTLTGPTRLRYPPPV